MKVLIPVLLLNSLWFAAVLGAANQVLWPALMLSLLLVSYVLATRKDRHKMGLIILVSIACGILFDGFLMTMEWVTYQQHGYQYSLFPPMWILLLWVGFGAAVVPGMQWLLDRPIWGCMLMAVGAPISYVSATKLGAITLSEPVFALLFIGLTWVLYFSLIVYLNARKPDHNHALA